MGFSVSSAPDRSGTGHARHGGDRSNTTCSYVSGISQTSSTSSLTTCDLVSQWKQFLTVQARGILAVDFVHVQTLLLRRIGTVPLISSHRLKLTSAHRKSTSPSTGSAENKSWADSRTSTISPSDSPRYNEKTQATATIEYSSPTRW